AHLVLHSFPTRRSSDLRDSWVEALTRQPFELQLFNDFTDDLIDREIGRINDGCIARDDERRGEPGRIGKIARGDFVALALRSARSEEHTSELQSPYDLV